MPSQQGDFVTEQSRLASLYSAANLRYTYNQTHACRLGCRLLSGFQVESPIFASGVLEDEGNNVQGAGDVFRLMECPRSRIPAVMLSIVKIVQCFGATIQLDQTQDPPKITIDGQLSAVGGAEAAVRELINGGSSYLDSSGAGDPGTEASGGGPEGVSGASSSLPQFSYASNIV